MKKILVFLAFLIFLAGCSSADLALSDLKANYPNSFAEPIDSLPESKQERVGLPDELPFEVKAVAASAAGKEVTVRYHSTEAHDLTVTTLFDPSGEMAETDLQIPLNSGSVAGVREEKKQVFVEWYNSDEDVIYQIDYSAVDKEKQTQQAMDIANSIN
ncbi:hypothetical protein SAMN05216353_11715 [Halobacillus alkaliphilus]|uniref:DUF4367 domain-containing protein n=1 Tax=Halobacillus alkaliphilus TaxID=396056 RepID=A0A1I2N9K4_9BACI|nr:membrane lipoprotein lipid attachment site-containing protein [Halobacillus alkaliphilus]SFF98186.1 hypothetical protein SAMN05216353_11715 [Halobacillus alkaliphilus]